MTKYNDLAFETFLLVVAALIVAIVVLLFNVLPGYGQQTTIYGPDGRTIGHEIQSGNSSTLYGANGSVQGRSRTDSGGTTTYYGADGRVIGKSIKDRK
jgi:hypothetical protein